MTSSPQGSDPADVKTKAEALGMLIRSGVDPQDAADRVGLTNIDFTGAMPVSLRLPGVDANAAAMEPFSGGPGA